MKRYTLALIFFFSINFLFSQHKSGTTVYLSTPESLKNRVTPGWYDSAKFGIFIHWGLYSVPGWATPIGTPDTVTDWKYFYANNPYAEWYLNSLRIDNSATRQYHNQKYGSSYDYYDFAKVFNSSVAKWQADTWVKLFKKSGAKYIVLTAKHSDGFTLYPSTVIHPLMQKKIINSPRDLVKELMEASRGKGLKFGVYYSGGLDWSFTQTPVTKIWPDLFENIPKSVAYTSYADMQFFEIIHRYKPDILWNDISYPKNGDVTGIFAELFNLNPGAVINNRWGTLNNLTDFDTPEYQVSDTISKRKWESCRGIGYSFGYNRLENEKQFLSADQLVDMLIDIVSKNGNFLLDVGPKANGEIPEAQANRILEIGSWLDINGESIYNTRPWIKAESLTSDSIKIRFTQSEQSLYLNLLDRPATSEIKIPEMRLKKNSLIQLLGYDKNLSWRQEGDYIVIEFPAVNNLKYAYTLKITPKPLDN